MTAARDVIARAGFRTPGAWEKATPRARQVAYGFADHILAALTAAGLVVASTESSEEFGELLTTAGANHGAKDRG